MKRSILVLTAVAVLVVSGGAFAAAQITGRQIKDSSITGKDVKNKSLTRADFRGSVQGPRGLTGPAGPAGAAGPPGPSAVSALTISSGSKTVDAGAVDGGTLPCPSGTRAIGGGFYVDGGVVFLNAMADDARSGWTVAVDNAGGSAPITLSVEVYCASADQAVAARAGTRRALRPLTGSSLRRLDARRAAR